MDISKLRHIVSYDPNTGILTRLQKQANNAHPGPITCTNADGYIQVTINGKFFYGHRLAWVLHYGIAPAGTIDHINGIKTDNRIENLRCVSASQNCQNARRRSDNKSGHKNVSWSKQKHKWVVKVCVAGHVRHGGYFDTVSDAANSAALLRSALHGEFSRGD